MLRSGLLISITITILCRTNNDREMIISGQFETYLFQKGEPMILEAIKKCWASSFSMQVMQHRIDCGLSTDNIAMAVVIQVSLLGYLTLYELYLPCMILYIYIYQVFFEGFLKVSNIFETTF